MHLLATLALLLAAAPGGASYHPLDWEALARGEAGPGRVRVTGRYLPYAGYSARVSGVLTQGRLALRVEGESFDWMPQAGDTVELWGQLETDERGPVLRFHNGRRARDPRRAPRALAELKAGERVRLWLRVTQGGGTPFPIATGVTEDGRSVTLPATYPGPFGVVCVEGTVGTLGPGFALREPTPCPRR
jgi:hypothetical protein